jgi:hypothetical protein
MFPERRAGNFTLAASSSRHPSVNPESIARLE